MRGAPGSRTIASVRVVELSQGPIDVAALVDARAIELRAGAGEDAALAAALAALRGVRGLRALCLRSRVRSLPPALTELRGLQRLELVDPELPGLPLEISRLSRLRSLRLELLHLASLPHSVGGLGRLRELEIASHHLCGLPDGVRGLQALRSLTLVLDHVYVHDWERPTHVRPRWTQPLERLFGLLAGLPGLTSLRLGEPRSLTGRCVLDRLPGEFAGLRALESLTIGEMGRLALPHGVVMPAVRRIRAPYGAFDATAEELAAMFPNASVLRPGDP